ncbi:hypothetical protein Tco_0827157, partial [Tanacetum coccineum]
FPSPPKKSRGKGSQGKKTVDDSQETVDVSEESEPKLIKKKTASRRVVKKKVPIFADDNIIPDPDVALKLGKSISLAEAKEEEATKQPKLKGVQTLTPKEQEAADAMQDLKESKKTSSRQSSTRGSSEGTGRIPGDPDESTVISATSSEGNEDLNEKEDIDWIDFEGDDEKKDDTDDDKSIDLEMTDDEETDDEVLQGKEQVYDYEDEEMLNAEVEDSRKGDAEVFDAAKADAEKTEEAKDDSKKAELPPTSSNLSISLGFGDQFLKLSSDTSLIGTVKDTTNAEISSLLDIKIQSEVPHIQSPSMLKVPVSVISKPSVLTPVQETASAALVTTLPPPSVSIIPPAPLQKTTTPIPPPPITTDAPIITSAIPESDALYVVQLRVAKLEKDVSELKKIDHSTKALATLKSQVPTVVEQYLGSKIDDDLQKIPTEKSASEILNIKKEQAEKQKMPKYTIKSTDKASLKEYDQKTLIEDENAMDKGVADTVKDHKQKHDDDDDDDDDPPAGPNQGKKIKSRRTKESDSSKKPSFTKETPKGKAPSKGSKTGKSASAKEPVKEPIIEVVMDDVGEDVVRDDDQPQDTSKPKTAKTSNPEWFKQPPRPPTPDLEWNKRQVVLGQPEQPWFNQMVSATKDPLTFNDLMATPIDFSEYNNPEGDRYPFDRSKPLPLQGHSGHLTIVADYFFNNDLKYLKSSDLERTYTTSITKTKAARYEIEGIEDMVPCFRCQETAWIWSFRRDCGERADRQLYKFKKGDFIDLHLNGIEDMLLLAIQHKLFHLTDSQIVDFIVALRMFTRSLIIKKLVEDLQLSVDSYQKKLNITLPQQNFLKIEFKELYTPSHKLPGVIYEDLTKQKIVMRADELYKFSDGTLKKVRDELHQRVLDFDLGYNKEMLRRKWTAIDKKRSKLMVELIDKQMSKRRIIQNLLVLGNSRWTTN